MNTHEKLNYVEFAARDLPATKTFFAAVFGWEFVDYGPDYAAFSNQGLNGGFFKADLCSQTSNGAALLVFYSADIQSTLQKVISNGGTINKLLFDFPGGCRFHFIEPSGNEFAVWSEVKGSENSVALAEADVEAGCFVTESVAEHMQRITDDRS